MIKTYILLTKTNWFTVRYQETYSNSKVNFNYSIDRLF